MAKLNPILMRLFQAHAAVPRRLSASGRAFKPLHLSIEVTYRCNLRCNFCQYLDIIEGTAEHIGPNNEFSFEQICASIDQFPRGRLITFSGGETLMRKDFPDILAHACRHHRTHIVTNGVLIRESIARRYIELAPRYPWGKGLVLLGISLEGNAEVHDRIVGRPGSWRRTVDAIESLVRLRRDAGKRYPKMGLMIVVTRETAGGLEEFLRLAHGLDMDLINLITEHTIVPHSGTLVSQPAEDRIHVPQPKPEGVDPEALRDELTAVYALAQELGIEIKTTPSGLPIAEFVRHYSDDRSLSGDDYICGAAWSRICIGADGRYTPSCPYLRFGDVTTDSIATIWNGPELRDFRQRVAKDRVFAGCSGCCNLHYTGPLAAGAAGRRATPTS